MGIKAFKYYLLFPSIGRTKVGDPELQDVLKDIGTRVTFRLSEQEQRSSLTVLRLAYHGIKDALFTPLTEHPKQRVAIFDGAKKSEPIRRSYLQFFGEKEVPIFIAREDILRTTPTKALIPPLFSTFLFIPVFFLKAILYPSDSGTGALALKEHLECQALLYILRKSKVEKLYHFSISERDANLLTLILRRNGIHSTKISSNTPIGFYNQFLLADRLVVNSHYQKEECSYFRTRIQGKVEVWGPEGLPAYFPSYQKELTSPEKKTLGLYSNGVWLRKELGHIDPGTGNFPSEEKLLELLAQTLEKDPETQLIVFPHPKEKEDEKRFKRSVDFYKEKLGEGVKVAGPDKATPFHFDSVEVALGAFSNSLMERLYMGYKTFFYVEYFKDFPFPGSDIEKICLQRPEELLEDPERIFSETYDPLRSDTLRKYTFKGSTLSEFATT